MCPIQLQLYHGTSTHEHAVLDVLNDQDLLGFVDLLANLQASIPHPSVCSMVSRSTWPSNPYYIYYLCYLIFKAFLIIHWEVVEMIQGTVRDVLKHWLANPPKLCGWAHHLAEALVLLLVPLSSVWAARSSWRGPRESRICKIGIACERLAHRQRTSSMLNCSQNGIQLSMSPSNLGASSFGTFNALEAPGVGVADGLEITILF